MSEELPPDVADADSVRPLPVDRETQPVDGEGAPRLAFPVVGLGASAGGLEAYTEFLQAMPANSGMAFVLIQHLSPKHESMIAEILSRHTTMPVLQVEDGMKVEADHVYVIRPGHTMTIHNGHLHLGKSLLAPGHNRPVDDFFRSLAEEQRERAIGIILSGMGSNGSAGAQMIKAVGGICIAQDPDSCKFASMPRSLIESGVADFVMKPAEMPELLSKYANHPYAKGERSKAASRNRRDAGALDEILTVLRTRTRVDYRGYKKPTVLRRVQRRMGLHQVTAMGDYVRTLRQNPSEISALSDDLLIHVTGFFRDPDAWNRLRETVILPLVQQREDEASIRCWVTACSSGEEAYTLAILLLEAAESVNKRFEIKIFATDMAERTLQHARAGIYPGGIESEITPERLERFFEKDDAFYHVKQELREVVVFAPQNLLQDPPFSRLDIVSCRNLLIYLEPETQQRVMALLHFGLREGGTLFLGTSETIGDDELFEPIDKTWRIFRRIGPTRHGAVVFPPAHALTVRMNELEASATEPKAIVRSSVPQAANRLLLEQFTPAAVVVDRQGRIVFYHGSTARFLAQPPGEPTRDLLVMARDTVRGALRSAFGRAMDSGEAVQVKDGIIDTETGRQRVEIRAVPLEGRVTSAYFLISFIAYPESTPPIEPPKGNGDHYAWATGELQRVRDELQSTVEELQTSNEEMKASHEEITSINEELQSTNEEL
ncbi:MAG TPA: chemotaxis protein CheB, partial [Tepidisphaeraceae bacterium]